MQVSPISVVSALHCVPGTSQRRHLVAWPSSTCIRLHPELSYPRPLVALLFSNAGSQHGQRGVAPGETPSSQRCVLILLRMGKARCLNPRPQFTLFKMS